MSIKEIDKTKYVEIDTDQDIFKGKTLKEQNKIAKKYILDNFKGKLLIIGNKEEHALITRRSANEYTYPKKSLKLIERKSKIKASTELDNILKISKYKYSKKDDGIIMKQNLK